MTLIQENPVHLRQAPVVPSQPIEGSGWSIAHHSSVPSTILKPCAGNESGRLKRKATIGFSAGDDDDEFECYPVTLDKYSQRPIDHIYRGWRRVSKDQAENDLEAEWLRRKFLQVSGYRSYRNRQPKEGKKKEDCKWPDNLERAFFLAIIHYRPVGRHKERLHEHGKLMGRNELVADYIVRRTGVSRIRKQVSSHIQVLKDFVGHDPMLLSYLLSPKHTTKHKHKQQEKYRKKHCAYPSNNVINPMVQSLRTQASEKAGCDPISELSTDLQIASFDMSLFVEDSLQNEKDPLHVYAKSSLSSRMSSIHYEDLQHCAQSYPELGMHHIQWSDNYNFVAANASIAMPNCRLGGKTELVISMLLRGAFFLDMPKVESTTTFFKDGRPDEPHVGKGEAYPADNFKDPCFYQVPFCSSTWAPLLSRLGNMVQKANEEETRPLHHGETQAMRDDVVDNIRENIAEAFENTTAVQEIRVRDEKGQKSLTLLTVRWSFTSAAEGQPGTTTWRNLIVPPPEDPWNLEAFQSSMKDFDTGEFRLDELVNYGLTQISQPLQLQSPIEFIGEGTSAWGAPQSTLDDRAYSFDVNTHNVNDFDFTGGNVHIAFNGEMPLNKLENGTQDTGINGFPTSSMNHFHQQWDAYDTLLDPQMLAHSTAVESIYPTPTSAIDTAQHAFLNTGTLPGLNPDASFAVKEEDLSQVPLSHDCPSCIQQPFCLCLGPVIKQSDSQGVDEGSQEWTVL